MTVAKGRSPQAAFDLVKSYTAAGDEGQAARVYAESSLSLKRYMQAIHEGRQAKGDTR